MSARLKLLLVVGILATLAALQAPSHAQDKDPEGNAKQKTKELLDKAKEEYRIYFKQPKTTYEFWSAIKFEMDLGKFDLAAYHLNAMLGKNPDIKMDADVVDKELVKIEQAEGMSSFLRLKQVRKKDWSDHPPFQKQAEEDVDELIDRTTKALEKHLSDPDRIKKFIKQLDGPTVEERAFAFAQLARSRERAVPYLIEALRTSFGTTLYSRLKETMIKIGPETVPVYLEVFRAANDKDYNDIELRTTLLDIIRQRDDKRVIPYLWHLSASKKYPAAVRAKATDVLASLLRTDALNLPPAKESLIVLAEKYYQHQVNMPAGKPVQIWPWDGQSLALKPVELTPYQAEEFFSQRYAREALDLDSSLVPAQVVFLSSTLERIYRPKLDTIFLEPLPPKMHELLTTIDADLEMRTLERAFDDKNPAVIVPLVLALGGRGEYRAAQLKAGGRPSGVVRALYYPDRRVQFAGLLAMLQMPATSVAPAAAERVVELSRRFLASEPNPKALVINAPAAKEAEIRKTLKELGFTAEIARKVPEAFEKAKASADFDLVVLDQGVNAAEFPFIFGQIRKSADLGGLPVLVLVDKNREKAIKQFAGKDDHVAVLEEVRFKADNDLKSLLDSLLKTAQVVRLSPDERKLFPKVSLDVLLKMAKGEIQGYNLQPTLDTVIDQLRSKDFAIDAIQILGRLPGKEVQYKLAGLAADPKSDKLRGPAAFELNRHMQKNGVQIDKNLIKQLVAAQKDPMTDPAVRQFLTVTASLIARSTPPQTGAQLFQFRPDAPAPPPPAKEKEEKKDKDN